MTTLPSCCHSVLVDFVTVCGFIALCVFFSLKMLHFFEFVFLSFVACGLAGKESFDSDNFLVEWMVMPETKEIQFNLSVKTVGWVGLGVSLVNADMKELDIVVGGVNNKTVYIWDMYANGKARPVKDAKQDINSKFVMQKDGKTMISFNRKLNTGDNKNDVEIKANVGYYLAWAFDTEGAVNATSGFPKHSNRGYSKSIKLYTTSLAAITASPGILLLVVAAAFHLLTFM